MYQIPVLYRCFLYDPPERGLKNLTIADCKLNSFVIAVSLQHYYETSFNLDKINTKVPSADKSLHKYFIVNRLNCNELSKLVALFSII